MQSESPRLDGDWTMTSKGGRAGERVVILTSGGRVGWGPERKGGGSQTNASEVLHGDGEDRLAQVDTEHLSAGELLEHACYRRGGSERSHLPEVTQLPGSGAERARPAACVPQPCLRALWTSRGERLSLSWDRGGR